MLRSYMHLSLIWGRIIIVITVTVRLVLMGQVWIRRQGNVRPRALLDSQVLRRIMFRAIGLPVLQRLIMFKWVRITRRRVFAMVSVVEMLIT